MEKVLLNGSIVLVIAAAALALVPGLDVSVLQDGTLTIGDALVVGGNFLVMVGLGVVRFLVGKREKENAG